MNFTPGSIDKIILPAPLWESLLAHCRRKLKGDYLPGEAQEPKAFGVVGGRISGKVLYVEAVAPLLNNSRGERSQKGYMDEMMERHAIPSETPLSRRGWTADPDELRERLMEFKEIGCRLIASYHMHRVSWEHDPKRETPTELDEILGSDSRMFMFIIAMIDPQKPVIRAFFEGRDAFEVPITITTAP